MSQIIEIKGVAKNEESAKQIIKHIPFPVFMDWLNFSEETELEEGMSYEQIKDLVNYLLEHAERAYLEIYDTASKMGYAYYIEKGAYCKIENGIRYVYDPSKWQLTMLEGGREGGLLVANLNDKILYVLERRGNEQ